MKFKASFCDPTEAEMIELGDISQEAIIDQFEKIDWNDYLQKVITTKIDDIYYDPSFVVENKESKNSLVVSAVGEPHIYEFRITYNQPKEVKSFLGLNDKIDENYSNSIYGQLKKDALDCLKALLRNDTEYLSVKVGQ
jgi:hypothetical protein